MSKLSLQIGYNIGKYLCMIGAIKGKYDNEKQILTLKTLNGNTAVNIDIKIEREYLPNVILELGLDMEEV